MTRFKMDDGWTPGLHLFNGQNVRGILQDAELEVYEPQATSVHIVLTAAAVTTQQTMAVSVNGAVVKTMVFDQPGEFQAMDLGVVSLQASHNVLHFAGTQQCVDPTATFPATLNTKCLMFQMSSLQMVAPQSR
ncbi:MAG TPA: hypothetical protein VF510_04225 [Ktedonobacterales bacterium]